ncbi:MAG TPA: FemAB family PEP-CTERM system-associated protein [Phycisphaerales bacterium]|nr:FemAB family PEP-CTERM system-associated protein [Phycisphaerales bacterium]
MNSPVEDAVYCPVSPGLNRENRYTSAASEGACDICVGDGADPGCSDFVRSMPNARLCHVPQWSEMIERVFGHKSHYLVARDNGVICGVLPLSRVFSRLFGNRLISQPFSDYGGPLADSRAALDALYNRAVDIAREYRCDYIEFRNTVAIPQELYSRTDKVCMHVPLASDPQVVWKGLRPQIRNRIRQAEKSGIVVTDGGGEMLDEFYRLWTRRMRELGTPCYSRELFRGILDTFPDSSRIFLAHSGGKVAAAFFVYNFNGCAHSRWGAALREYDSLSPNYLLNWSAIEFYCRAEMKAFDFGRSTRNSGQYTFKKRWKARPVPLNWQYWIRPGHQLSLAKPDNPKYRRVVELWKKIPVSATRFIGPYISRNLP